MTAFPKPSTSKKGGVMGPKLTEEDFLEISDKIGEAMEHNNEVEITVFHQKRIEKISGVITSADSQTGFLQLSANHDSVRININNIVGVD
ncbi:YolD-like family protein [Sporosarcina sp. FA9]|uniref:YolD-like family protein n=1 Tax=Sporosarcina sp. FA9 TaxID=3413030 RepID=UPI003F660818